MVMLDVVVVIRVPSMSHQRFEDIWKGEIEESVSLRQHTVVVDMVMQHDGERSAVPARHDAVADGVRVREVEK